MVSNACRGHPFSLVRPITTHAQLNAPPKRAARTVEIVNLFPQEEKRSVFVRRGDHPCLRLA